MDGEVVRLDGDGVLPGVNLFGEAEHQEKRVGAGVDEAPVVPAPAVAKARARRINGERGGDDNVGVRDGDLREERAGGFGGPARGARREVLGAEVLAPTALKPVAE